MKALTILASLAVAASVLAAPSAPTAATVLNRAETAAKKDHKDVLLIFHASWCGWCHRFDGFLADPQMAPLMNKNYEIVHMDVLENPDKKDLENSGGVDLMNSYGGKDCGIPFYVILSPSGKVLATSLKDGSAPAPQRNIGYPAAPDEIAHFMDMLKTTSHLSTDNQAKIRGWLTANAPKMGG